MLQNEAFVTIGRLDYIFSEEFKEACKASQAGELAAQAEHMQSQPHHGPSHASRASESSALVSIWLSKQS